MDKLICWILTIALLCSWSEPIYGNNSLSKYRGLGINSEDKGEIVVFILIVVIEEIGKKLAKGYKCPVYCDVSHKHIYWENYETEESNISPDDGLPGSDKPEDREQSEGSVRSIASTD